MLAYVMITVFRDFNTVNSETLNKLAWQLREVFE
jgi:hypothetical protein